MDDEDLKDLMEEDEPEFDSLRNVMHKRYDKIVNEAEEECDSPAKKRR
jgi:hypothetical protein